MCQQFRCRAVSDRSRSRSDFKLLYCSNAYIRTTVLLLFYGEFHYLSYSSKYIRYGRTVQLHEGKHRPRKHHIMIAERASQSSVPEFLTSTTAEEVLLHIVSIEAKIGCFLVPSNLVIASSTFCCCCLSHIN